MAFPPPGPFGPNFGTMPPAFLHLNANAAAAAAAAAAAHQYGGIHHPGSIPIPTLPPMSGLVPSPLLPGYPPNLIPVPAAASGMITVPAGSVTAAAPPVRSLLTEFTSGFRPNINPPPLQPPQQQQTFEGKVEMKKPSGPSITVFVGSISERASDTLIRLLLTKCGYVNVWKRVQGANGKLQGFGFCDFGDPESAMTAIRILNDLEIGERKLVVKADGKAKSEIQEYLKKKNPNSSVDDDEKIDDETKKLDEKLKIEINELLKEHESELSKDKEDSKSTSRKTSSNRGNGDVKGENLDDMEMEEEKRSLINREIDKFRDTYKEDDNDKDSVKDIDRKEGSIGKYENDRSKRDQRDTRRERSPPSDRIRDRNRKRDVSSKDRRDRRDDIRSDSRDDLILTEDEIERRKIDRQLREKENSYQIRLRNWEVRESRKSREFDDRARKDADKRDEELRESRKLKIFLEDYDDDRDDPKYYRPSKMKVLMDQRRREIQEDERDRRMEKRELEELRSKLSQDEQGVSVDDDNSNHHVSPATSNSNGDKVKSVNDKIRDLMAQARSSSLNQITTQEDASLSGLSDSQTPREELHLNPFSLQGKRIEKRPDDSLDTSPALDKKKRPVPDIFNSHDDDDSSVSKKRRLPTLNEDDDSSSSRIMSKEEKEKQIRELISEIPTTKDALFAYEIDWSWVDPSLMDKRIRPWVNKKINEFIGEEEPALVDFICTKLAARSSAQLILNEVVMVLDEEAEVFVVKLWRLLIYEIKAKKAGLAK